MLCLQSKAMILPTDSCLTELQTGSNSVGARNHRPKTHRRLILSNFTAPGDIVMMTGSIRDLHRRYPNVFQTDVRTHFPDLWLHNPFVTPLNEKDDAVETIQCEFPLDI